MESRVARQLRLEKRALRIIGTLALSCIAVNIAWAVAKAVLPQGHIDCTQSLSKLRFGMQRPDLVRLLGKPDGREVWMPSLCGMDGGPWYSDVYFDDTDRDLKLLVNCEPGYVEGAELRDSDDNVLASIQTP